MHNPERRGLWDQTIGDGNGREDFHHLQSYLIKRTLFRSLPSISPLDAFSLSTINARKEVGCTFFPALSIKCSNAQLAGGG